MLSVRGMDTIKTHKSPFQRSALMCICLPVSPQQYTVQTYWAASWVASTHQWSGEKDTLYGSGNTIHPNRAPIVPPHNKTKPINHSAPNISWQAGCRRDRERGECVLLWSTVLLTASEEKSREGEEEGEKELETTPCQSFIYLRQFCPKADGTRTDDVTQWKRDERSVNVIDSGNERKYIDLWHIF